MGWISVHLVCFHVCGTWTKHRGNCQIGNNSCWLTVCRRIVIVPCKHQFSSRTFHGRCIWIRHDHSHMQRITSRCIAQNIGSTIVRQKIREINSIDRIRNGSPVWQETIIHIGRSNLFVSICGRSEKHLQIIINAFTACHHIKGDRDRLIGTHGEYLLRYWKRRRIHIITRIRTIFTYKQAIACSVRSQRPGHPTVMTCSI